MAKKRMPMPYMDTFINKWCYSDFFLAVFLCPCCESLYFQTILSLAGIIELRDTEITDSKYQIVY